jgi:hypothetical protein
VYTQRRNWDQCAGWHWQLVSFHDSTAVSRLWHTGEYCSFVVDFPSYPATHRGESISIDHASYLRRKKDENIHHKCYIFGLKWKKKQKHIVVWSIFKPITTIITYWQSINTPKYTVYWGIPFLFIFLEGKCDSFKIVENNRKKLACLGERRGCGERTVRNANKSSSCLLPF